MIGGSTHDENRNSSSHVVRAASAPFASTFAFGFGFWLLLLVCDLTSGWSAHVAAPTGHRLGKGKGCNLGCHAVVVDGALASAIDSPG